MNAMKMSVVEKFDQVASVMLFQVNDCSFEVGNVIAEVAKGSVASVAQKPTDFTGGMAVVYVPVVDSLGRFRVVP